MDPIHPAAQTNTKRSNNFGRLCCLTSFLRTLNFLIIIHHLYTRRFIITRFDSLTKFEAIWKVIPRLAQANRIHNEAASRLLMSPSIISTTHNMQMKHQLNNITNAPHLSIYIQEPPLMSLRHRQVSKLFFLFTSLTNNTRNHNDILVKKIEKNNEIDVVSSCCVETPGSFYVF